MLQVELVSKWFFLLLAEVDTIKLSHRALLEIGGMQL